jgi:hypothetical protein
MIQLLVGVITCPYQKVDVYVLEYPDEGLCQPSR